MVAYTQSPPSALSLSLLLSPISLFSTFLLSLSDFQMYGNSHFYEAFQKKIIQKRELANLEISSLAGHRPWDSESLESS